MKVLSCSLWSIGLLVQAVSAVIEIDVTNPESIKRAAAIAAAGMTQYYTGHLPGDVPGNLPDPYYWWEAGAMFGALLDYWYFTGDETYNDMTMQAMQHQVGAQAVYMPENQTLSLGNDDQAFWGLSAMTAAENRFPNPPEGQPQWLALAQGVFNTQAHRWDTLTCGGGLRWQIFQFKTGYTYKNSISNGCFFNLAARLATYTGNSSYADWAERTWEWTQSSGLITADYGILDGSYVSTNCTTFDSIQWSYNAGTFLAGAANMYNYTGGSAIWEERIRGIIGNLKIFLVDNVMIESACEAIRSCNIDQRSFKAYLARWMAAAIIRAPFTRELLKPILETSAKAAAATCIGGADGQQCTTFWTNTSQAFQTGVGEQMSALEVFQTNLLDWTPGPATEVTGISVGDPGAGSNAPLTPEDFHKEPVTAGDQAGAAIVTILIIVLVLSMLIWLHVE